MFTFRDKESATAAM